jgi:hypothetical protein
MELGGAKDAKQTQSPTDTQYSTVPSFQYSKREPIVRNEANFHQRANREIGVPGGNRAKQTQLGPGQNQSQVHCSKEVRSDSPQHGHGKNKANW